VDPWTLYPPNTDLLGCYLLDLVTGHMVTAADSGDGFKISALNDLEV
jgi:hypothetical protein